MKKFHVYGIGNALVDLDYEVDPNTLKALNIEKGRMTLVDESRHRFLLEHLTSYQHKKACGGSAANTMIAISQFGGNSFYSCRIANDGAGLFYLNDLHKHGVKSNLTRETLSEGHSGKCIVFVTPDADRTMNTYLGATADLSPSDVVPDAIAASEYAYIEGYLVSSQSARDAAVMTREIAEQQNTKIALSLSDPNMTVHFKTGLEKMLGQGIDLLFCNEDEALCFTNANDLTTAIAGLKRYAKTFAITRGAKGACIYDGSECHDILAHPMKPIDTVGAGDMFAGAMLYGMTHGLNVVDAAQLANQAAAHIVAQVGPRLDDDKAFILPQLATEIFETALIGDVA